MVLSGPLGASGVPWVSCKGPLGAFFGGSAHGTTLNGPERGEVEGPKRTLPAPVSDRPPIGRMRRARVGE